MTFFFATATAFRHAPAVPVPPPLRVSSVFECMAHIYMCMSYWIEEGGYVKPTARRMQQQKGLNENFMKQQKKEKKVATFLETDRKAWAWEEEPNLSGVDDDDEMSGGGAGGDGGVWGCANDSFKSMKNLFRFYSKMYFIHRALVCLTVAVFCKVFVPHYPTYPFHHYSAAAICLYRAII